MQRAGVTSQFEIRIDEKTYVGADGSRLTAIRDFVLDVAQESMTVLMGPSGCGKTTLLRIVAGLDDRFVGKVNVPEGARIGVMFQEPRLLPWRTVRQNIELVAAPDFSAEDLEWLAQAVGIADMLPRYPQELSLGLARRVALARAFATKPDLLLLDEPFVSLDERTADRLRRLLLEVWSARPTTAILVTHNAREAILLADQLVLLAPRPTHVVTVETIAVPQAERDPQAIEAIHVDLLERYPANFSGR
ncbi:MAG: ABC transporter ATP-binding protein [Methyloceanibacter sp.]|jgi:NitT/TauT family transport system ATP-binding protein|uniref:ABC transporter ATP-binding protein n=1 Tax=Methyloceanibacter sp. TaxID=1965321 RepID=UPI003D9AFB86